MVFKLWFLLMIATICFIQQSHQETVEITRAYHNEKFIDTIVTTLDNGTILKNECDEDKVALQTVRNKVQCINVAAISSVLPKDCQFGFKQIPPKTTFSKFQVKTYEDFLNNPNTSWKGIEKSCLKLTYSGKYIANTTSCSGDDTIAGFLVKAMYSFSGTLANACVIFTAPGKVSEQTISTTTKPPKSPDTSTPGTTVGTDNINTTVVPNNETSAGAMSTTISSNSPGLNLTTTAATSTNVTIPTTLTPPSTTLTQTTVLASPEATTSTTIKTSTSQDSTAKVPETPISKKDKSSAPPWHIIIPICLLVISIIIIVICLVFCRKRCKRGKKEAIPLLEINAGRDIVEEEDALYALPDKKKKKKPKEEDEPSAPVWSGYDDVGAFIEGTYEARDSVHLDPDSKYGVSAMLLKDEKVGKGLEKPENPYEHLGRCNSFTPKTRTEKSKYEKQREEKSKDGVHDDENTPESNTDPTNVDPQSGKEEDRKESELQKYSPTMPMSSFKPGNSIRRKQERTSMRKPKGSSNDPTPSLTHEVVNITPQPSKKYRTNLSTENITDDPNDELDSKPPLDTVSTSDDGKLYGEISPEQTPPTIVDFLSETEHGNSKSEDDLYEKVNNDDNADGYEKIDNVSLPDEPNEEINTEPARRSKRTPPTSPPTSPPPPPPIDELENDELKNLEKQNGSTPIINPYEELGGIPDKNIENRVDGDIDDGNYEPLPEITPPQKPKKASYADIEIIKDKKDKKKKKPSMKANKNGRTNYTEVTIDSE